MKHAERAARRPKQAKLARNAALRIYVEERLVWRRCGSERGSWFPARSCPGKAVGTDHGRTGDGQTPWSPEQIARRLPVDFADDATMRISHEAIYQALFVQGSRRVAPRRLTASPAHRARACGCRGRARAWRGKTFISPEIAIS